MHSTKDGCRILCGFCPDNKCRAKLFFPFFDTSIECTHCGQRHERTAVQNVKVVQNLEAAMDNIVRNILMSNFVPKRGTEMVKVCGLSNYHCKLLSPLLTKYGMDKKTGEAKLLTEMNQGDIFDCALFGDRAFLIDQEHLSVPGFGRDVSGSMYYLAETLERIKTCNDNEERLVPIHADGDGHCLVHAVSRALVGRELFWHPLRCSLKKHFVDNIQTYKELFKDFVDEREWSSIIDECDPDFIPPDGELLGLRNIHIFGLANVLKRPIILLDSYECMQSLADYAALFLPSLVEPQLCKGKNNQLNRPLCIAWSSSGHNHYIPLVGIKKKPLPKLPFTLLPKVWGVPQSLIFDYIEFDDRSCCTIGGDRTLGDPYILRLVAAMEKLFYEQKSVHPALVADVHHFLYQSQGVVGADRESVIQKTKRAVDEGRLYHCLKCDAICEQNILPQWFRSGGVLYNTALQQCKRFTSTKLYPFPLHGIVCRYDPDKDELIPDMNLSCLTFCTWCHKGVLRKIRADGSIMYKNDDQTRTPSVSSKCDCGYKHYWFGKEYDNPPKKLAVTLEWNNKVIKDSVYWFEGESDPSLNSNVFDIASNVVQKHFPGEFGSERLVQRVVEQILNQTKIPDNTSQTLRSKPSTEAIDGSSASKIVISGKGILHKEELGLSEVEKKILNQTEVRAASMQKRQSNKEQEIKSLENIVKVCTENIQKEEKPVLEPVAENQSQSVILKTEFVKVVTSDGKQAKLPLPENGLSYEELQKWIVDKFQIPESQQRIKYGFPPQELLVPSSGDKSLPVPLSNGDRVIVETIPLHAFSPQSRYSENETITYDLKRNYPQKTQEDINEADLISSSISELQNMAFLLSSSSLWHHAKKVPGLFKRGGYFYKLMENDVGLEHNRHHTFKTFPDKVLVYNAETDSLDLCLEPCGHFRIHENVEQDIREVLNHNMTANFAALSKPKSEIRKNVAFSGFTSSKSLLKSEHKAKVAKSSSDDSSSEQIIASSAPVLVRKGPGYSVLSSADTGKSDIKRMQFTVNQVTKDTAEDVKMTLTVLDNTYSRSAENNKMNDLQELSSKNSDKNDALPLDLDKTVCASNPSATEENLQQTETVISDKVSQDVDMVSYEKKSVYSVSNTSNNLDESADNKNIIQEMDVEKQIKQTTTNSCINNDINMTVCEKNSPMDSTAPESGDSEKCTEIKNDQDMDIDNISSIS